MNSMKPDPRYTYQLYSFDTKGPLFGRPCKGWIITRVADYGSTYFLSRMSSGNFWYSFRKFATTFYNENRARRIYNELVEEEANRTEPELSLEANSKS